MFIYMAHLSTTDQSAAQHSIKQLENEIKKKNSKRKRLKV